MGKFSRLEWSGCVVVCREDEPISCVVIYGNRSGMGSGWSLLCNLEWVLWSGVNMCSSSSVGVDGRGDGRSDVGDVLVSVVCVLRL